MNELQELHIKGELAGRGYLKESWDNESNDLKHELTDQGKAEIAQILKDPAYRAEFVKMSIEEARKHSPEVARRILQSIAEKIKSFQEIK